MCADDSNQIYSTQPRPRCRVQGPAARCMSSASYGGRAILAQFTHALNSAYNEASVVPCRTWTISMTLPATPMPIMEFHIRLRQPLLQQLPPSQRGRSAEAQAEVQPESDSEAAWLQNQTQTVPQPALRLTSLTRPAPLHPSPPDSASASA